MIAPKASTDGREPCDRSRGCHPADLPVEQPTRYVTSINPRSQKPLASAYPRRCSQAPTRWLN